MNVPPILPHFVDDTTQCPSALLKPTFPARIYICLPMLVVQQSISTNRLDIWVQILSPPTSNAHRRSRLCTTLISEQLSKGAIKVPNNKAAISLSPTVCRRNRCHSSVRCLRQQWLSTNSRILLSSIHRYHILYSRVSLIN